MVDRVAMSFRVFNTNVEIPSTPKQQPDLPVMRFKGANTGRSGDFDLMGNDFGIADGSV